jgi:hypothetical protein
MTRRICLPASPGSSPNALVFACAAGLHAHATMLSSPSASADPGSLGCGRRQGRRRCADAVLSDSAPPECDVQRMLASARVARAAVASSDCAPSRTESGRAAVVVWQFLDETPLPSSTTRRVRHLARRLAGPGLCRLRRPRGLAVHVGRGFLGAASPRPAAPQAGEMKRPRRTRDSGCTSSPSAASTVIRGADVGGPHGKRCTGRGANKVQVRVGR